MAGKAIGKTLPYGFRGAVTRTPDTIIAPYANVDTGNIEFGEPVAFDAEKHGVRKLTTSDSDNKAVVGIAVRRIGQPHADNPNGWYYAPGETVDVLLRGSIAVELADAASLAARGPVYVHNGNGDKPAGSIVCAEDAGNTVAIPNAVFAMGSCDSNKIAEVTILARSI